MLVALGAGWAVLRVTGSRDWLYVALAIGLLAYGVTVAVAVRSGAWFRPCSGAAAVARARE
jgi:hypothetical protein